MAHRIEYDPEAARDLLFHRHEQSRLRRQIEDALRDEPLRDTMNNGPMRPNSLDAPRRLRRPPFRVYYEVDQEDQLVYVIAICEKRGNRVFRRGREVSLSDEQDN